MMISSHQSHMAGSRVNLAGQTAAYPLPFVSQYYCRIAPSSLMRLFPWTWSETRIGRLNQLELFLLARTVSSIPGGLALDARNMRSHGCCCKATCDTY